MSISLRPLRGPGGIRIMYPIGVRPGEPTEPEPEGDPPILTRVQPANVITATQFWLEGENLSDVTAVWWRRGGGNRAPVSNFSVVDDEFIQGLTPNAFGDGTGLDLFWTVDNEWGTSNEVENAIGMPELQMPEPETGSWALRWNFPGNAVQSNGTPAATWPNPGQPLPGHLVRLDARQVAGPDGTIFGFEIIAGPWASGQVDPISPRIPLMAVGATEGSAFIFLPDGAFMQVLPFGKEGDNWATYGHDLYQWEPLS